MKPDGTHTVAEFIEMIRRELQSWERIELACELAGYDELLKGLDADTVATLTGYYVSDEDPEYNEDEVIEYTETRVLLDELLDRGEEETMLDHMDIEEDIIPYLEDKGYEVTK